MARRTTPPPPEDFEEHIVDIDVGDEMRTSFLEYAYSVIYSRALPDARDGLKPVQRRILYAMHDMGLRPERGHVKSSRVVGEVMGRFHPHGDGAIYDALVRMAQPFSMRLPTVDGHGNFGSPDDPPAAMRYTEARMAPAAVAMTATIDEDTIDFRPNYDGREQEPSVLPAALPHLVVNGASGIAVGMATNMAPHNLVEVVQALRHLVKKPEADLDALMRFIPGPDLPTGGKIIGLDGVRDAYESGRGSFRMRATTRIESVTARRKGIVVTELPYGVGTERVIAAIKKLVQTKKLQGISDVKDLTDRAKGLRLVIEVKNGFHPEALLEQLFRSTPLEESFGINAVALVDGQPRTLGLKEMLEVFLAHRFEVVRRRSTYRRGKAADRLHLVDGLLLAIIDIDEVIELIRSSDNAEMARERLISVFDLTEVQANYILDMPLRRLTKFSKIELDKEHDELLRTISDLDEILGDEARLRAVVSDELAEVAKTFGTPRRTVLLESSGQTATSSATPLEVADDPCYVFLSSSGLLARTTTLDPPGDGGGRARHDVIVSAVTVDGPRRGRRDHLRRPGGQARRARPAHAPEHRQPPQPAGRRARRGVPHPRRRAGAGADRVRPRLPRPRARHQARRGEAGEPGVPLGQGRLGRHLAQGRRRGGRRGRAPHRRRGAVLRHQRLPAAALRRRPGAPAGPVRRWHRRHQARGGRPGGLVHRARAGDSVSRSPSPGPRRRSPAPRPGRSRSRRSPSTPPRAAPPAASAATGSSGARTSSSSRGPVPLPRSPPRTVARRSTCPHRSPGATAPASREASRSSPAPARSPRPCPSYRPLLTSGPTPDVAG